MFARMKISSKLAFGFASITLLLLGVSVFSIIELRQVNKGCYEIGTNWMPSIGSSSDLNTNTSDYRMATAEHILTTDAARMQRREETLVEVDKKATENRNKYVVASPEEKKICDEFDSLWSQYKELTAKIIALSKAGKKDEAQKIYEVEARANYQRMGELQTQLVTLNIDAGQKTYEDSDATYKTASAALTGIGIGGTILSIFLAIVIARGITRPISHCTESLTQGALQVNQASGQVSQSSQTLASGASEQASSLEETSASLEELSSMTRQNADNSRQANALCTEASGAADRGSAAMKRMNNAINEIKSSADQTAKILKTIDEIAFQTNLLALNAAVEAARAGDAGKGFAVVAEEVRNLAQRSAEAAKNTAALIETGRKNADNGVAVAQDVAQNLDAIGNSIRKVTQLISEVASASEEQDRGVGQINIAVSNMDKTTQSNAATAEEAASASEELTAQAASLNDIVGALNALVYGEEKAAALRSQPAVAQAAQPRASLKRPDLNIKQAVDTTRRQGSVKMATRQPAVAKKTAAASQRPQDVIPLSDDDMKDF